MDNYRGMRQRDPNQQPAAFIFTILLIVLAMLVAGFMFVNSSFFAVGSVVVEGNKYIAVDEVYCIAGIPEQVNIFRLNASEIKNRLERDLRIAKVEVIRKFPSTIVITISERQPLAYISSGYGFVEIDKQGIILAAFKNLKQVNVPMVTGARLDKGFIGDKVDTPVIQGLLEYLSLLNENSLNQISEVNIKNPNQIVAYTIHSSQIRIGNSDRLAEKAKLTNEILKEISDRKMAVDYIDLNYSSPVIKFKQ